MDHRLGYPAVLRALFGAPAARVLPVYAAWPPIGGTTEGDKASTAEHDAKNAPKPVKRDEPYRPEFDFQYVDRKGHQGEVIPKREEPAESIITPLAPSAGVQADVPTEWQASDAWLSPRLSSGDGCTVKTEFGLAYDFEGSKSYHSVSRLDRSRRAAFIARCRELYKPEPQS